jgi:DNA-binding MarR family transcriptional regulator
MSTPRKPDLIAAIGFACMRWQEAVETFDETFGRLHDLNSAERRCLSSIVFGPQPASAIAKATGLTPAAVTSLVDRLAARDLVRRKADPQDRRKVMVEITEHALALSAPVYGPVQQEGEKMLAHYSADELKVILKFVEEARAMQEMLIERLAQQITKKA